MSLNLELFEPFFKPDVRSAGADLAASSDVFLKPGSDTQVDASVRASTPLKVALRSSSIASPEFTVDCTCKPSQKGQFCKHIWATILLASSKTPDFFDSKTSLLKSDGFVERAREAESARVSANPERAQAQAAREVAFKETQSNYRKEMYRKQKARAKDLKSNRDGESRDSKANRFLPESVQQALAYFEQNGFSLSVPIDQAALSNAKRVLSRVFHPDKGGTQDEILELLKHVEVLQAHR